MPFIVSRVTTKIDDSQAKKLTSGYVEKLQRLLGKSRSYVMIDLQDECPLYVRGEEGANGAYIEINLYGFTGGGGCSQLASEVTEMYNDVLGIPSENIFINFRDVPDFSIDGSYL